MATPTKIGPFGGPGGNNKWDDGVNDNIKQLNITSGVVIDSIQVLYSKNGKDVWTAKNGGPGGNKHTITFDYPNEYIVSISGYHSGHSNRDFVQVVQSLKIVTNKKTYGPFGTEEGQTFSIQPTGKKIVGFFGKFDWYVNSIGAYTAPLPAEKPQQTVGPFGGQGGNLWDDGVFTTIRQMQINHGDIIDSISVEYDYNGTSVWKEKHGQSSGGKKEEVKLDYPNEYIISVSGYHRSYFNNLVISSLKIQTNKRIWGPYGKEEGNPFKFPSSEGKIVGFHGRAGSSLDSIGAYVVPIIETQKYETTGPVGGEGGKAWDDGVNTAIKQIEISAGDVIDSIAIEYDKNGNTWSTKHGQSTGGTKSVIKLDYPNEYVISISGYHNTYKSGLIFTSILSSLKIVTNKATYGPYGQEKGTPFSFSGGKMVGLYGKSGIYVDSLGAYFVPVSQPIEHLKLGPFGGYGGSSWDDGVNNGIKQIEIHAGDIIDSFRIEYEKNGSTFWSDKRGQSTGGNKSLIKLDYPNEYIISISGYHNPYSSGSFRGDIITSLKITTNKQAYGPFGKENGNAFSINGGKVVGLHGKSGTYVDSIGGYVVQVVRPVVHKTSGPFGGLGGSSWDDGVNNTITQFEIFAGEIIESFRIEYEKNGQTIWSEKHGQSSGGNKSLIKLESPSEYVTAISGYHDVYGSGSFRGHIVTSIKITTNKQIYGPFGEKKGNAFLIEGGKVVGLHGKSGTYVDAIGGYVVPISRSVVHNTIGPFGGLGGSSWDDGVNNTITQVEIFAGEIIESFRIEYEKNGQTFWSEKHGQSSGGNKSLIKLDWPSEYVTAISGYNDVYGSGSFRGHIVTSMKITTNKKIYGPFGEKKGNAFLIEGGKVVGLHGKSGTYVDAIGAHVISEI